MPEYIQEDSKDILDTKIKGLTNGENTYIVYCCRSLEWT